MNTKKELLETLELIRQSRLCCYTNSKNHSNSKNFCDCKYGNLDKMIYLRHCGEQTGCCEMRDCIAFIEKYLEPLLIGVCRICNEPITYISVARKDNGTIRTDINGNLWCQLCTDKFDKLEPK